MSRPRSRAEKVTRLASAPTTMVVTPARSPDCSTTVSIRRAAGSPRLARSRVAGSVPVKWTSNGFIKPGTPNSANPLPPQIVHNTALFSDLGDKARATCRKLLGEGGDGELTSMRLHTRSSEIVLAPAHECTLVVVQKAHSAETATLVAIAEKAQMQAMEEAAKQPGGKK